MLYHATQWGYFLVFNKSGSLQKSKRVYTSGGTAGPAYPHLFVDEGGVIHYAMTTGDSDSNPYQTIRYVKSTDGGNAWKKMDGTTLSIPTSCAANGPSTMINLADEVDLNTWLGNMHVKNGKVHFMYTARGISPERQHYMRFNASSGVREIDSYSDWGNQWGNPKLHSQHGDGSFASDPDDPTGPLFAVGRYPANSWRKRLVALVSYDNGSTWQNHAITPSSGSGDISDNELRDVGGCRAITPDGNVIGSPAADRPSWATCYYYEFTSTATVRTNGVAAVDATGTVVFMQDGVTELSSEPLAGGVAQWVTDTLPYGTNTITAEYQGSDDYISSTSAPLAQVMTNPANRVTFCVSIASSSDDAEESPSGVMNLTSGDLDMVHDETEPDAGDQAIGLRFADIRAPHGTYVVSAHIQFTSEEVQTNAAALTIHGQAADDAATFSTSGSDVSSRAVTASSVAWSPAAWDTIGESGDAQQTPDLSALLQEVIDRPGWRRGNAVAFVITGSGDRTADSFEKAGGTPAQLAVSFKRSIPPLYVGNVQRAHDGALTLGWVSQAGKTYTVMASHDLSLSSWISITSGIPATGNETGIMIPPGTGPDPAVEPKLYFRIPEE